MDPIQVTQQVRYALSQLSGENAHHDFEHLSRRLTEQRIVSNVIPATGPVSAYGDQGRDFETFPTYIQSVDMAERCFVGLTSDKRLAFCCTLQKDSLKAKVLEDVKRIVESEVPFDGVFVFAEADVPVGLRNGIRDEVKSRCGLDFELFDGKAIAELLSDPEVFWIAARYLHLPAEIMPPPSEPKDSYEEAIERWRANDEPAGTYGEYLDLRRALRLTTFSKEHRKDLPFWLAQAERLRQATVPVLQRKLDYEISVACLRGMGTLSGQEERLRSYFSDVPSLDGPADLLDAQVLIQYTFGALVSGLVDLDPAEVESWRQVLADRFAELLPAAEGKDAAQLHESLGSLHLILPWDGVEDPAVNTSMLDAALESWDQAASFAEQAWLFPVDTLSDLVTAAAPMLAERPLYQPLTRRLDALTEQRGGRSRAAEKCRDRAMALFRAENLVAAIRELHSARIDWFTGDTLRGSLLALAITAHCYDKLGLHMAAKYYWLSLAYIAVNSGDQSVLDLAPTALLKSALSDYSQGNFISFIEIASVGLDHHAVLDKSPWDFEQDEDLRHTWFALSVTLVAGRRHHPQFAAQLESLLARYGLLEETERLLSADFANWLTQPSDAETAKKIEVELGAPGFADCGPNRTLVFCALGLTWRIEFANSHETVLAAERFAAFVQVIAAELAGVDLRLMPTEIRIRAEVTTDDASAEPKPSNDGRYWDVRLVPDLLLDPSMPPFAATLAAVLTVLGDVSLLEVAAFHARFEHAIAQRLEAKLVPGVIYDQAWRSFVPAARFSSEMRMAATPLTSGDAIIPNEHEALAWIDTPGPGYSQNKAQELLAHRYTRLRAALTNTFPRLLKNGKVRSDLKTLKAEGWLDWRIMNAVHTIVMNWRMRQEGDAPKTAAEFERIAAEVGFDDDEVTAAIPASEITLEAMMMADSVNLGAALKTWGLETHQRTPDIEAFRRLLDKRFGHSRDDIPHADPLDSTTWEYE